jgi:tetrapyrrole methylase family protein/MazG family protein
MPNAPEDLRNFESLLKVVEFLRGPNGCPWDKEQTHSSLTRFAIEEAFELAEAIDSGDFRLIKEELGDVLFQVVLHAEIARQEGRFEIHDVIETLNEKMVRRHPHVFADVKAKDSAEVLKNWSEIKAKEKGAATAKPLSFDIPQGLPALLRAQKIGEKTKKSDFDWKNAAETWPKIKEEIAELEDAVDRADRAAIEAELGDVLFSIAQLARHLGLDSEQALRKTNQRFEGRYHKMRQMVESDGKDWSSLTPSQKENYWKSAKV